jgi:glutamate-1-semialdehyde 2,1-aminomutase
MDMKKGNKLWERACKVIPGGNGLLSKRPNRYASEIWPTYYYKAKGALVQDLEGISYIDMAQMGIGCAILGYANEEVDSRVFETISNGINTTLNAPEEVYLAEKLLELNPFADGVKFARTGGEAMAIAVRIARAYSGKDKVAFSGYHGWTDWYIAANLSDEGNLNDHLLPGLKPRGVPRSLAGTVIPFKYNSVDEFLDVIRKYDIGVIVFEGARYDFPSSDFLNEIQKAAEEKEIVTVVDEITSGWRMTDGGVYKLNGFKPDIVVYGKAMGNGYAISAVVGKREVMDVAQESFISSTFWTERVGFTAALAAIDVMTRDKIWEQLNITGNKIGNEWLRLADKYGLKINITDFKPLITFKFNYGNLNQALTTLFIQEMLSEGYLASNSVYISTAHTDEIIGPYFESVDRVFKMIGESIDSDNVNSKLKVSIRDDGFKRLT